MPNSMCGQRRGALLAWKSAAICPSRVQVATLVDNRDFDEARDFPPVANNATANPGSAPGGPGIPVSAGA